MAFFTEGKGLVMQNTPPEPVRNEDLLSGFARLTEESASELDAALLVARVIDDHLDTEQTRTRVLKLAEAARADGVDDADALLTFLAGQGFGQGALTEVDLTHSSIDWLLQQHQGLPIVVAVLLITLAQALGMQAHGVNYPGHFLLQVDDELIDPIGLNVVRRDSLPHPEGVLTDELFSHASAMMIAFRMLNNVKAYNLRLQNWRGMLVVSDYQLALAHAEPSLSGMVHFERGEYRQQMGESDAALEEYTRCVDLCQHGALVEKAKARVQTLLAEHKGELH